LPRGTVNVYNVSLSFSGSGCAFGTSTLSGVAYYDEPGRRIHVAVPDAARTDVFLFTGTKP